MAGLVPGKGPIPVSAWVAFEDDTLRRIALELPFTASVPVGGVESGTVALDAQISSVGTDEEIEPPPGGGFQPIDRLIERIGGLAGLAL